MHIECMVMHDVQNESLVFLYQLGTLSPLPSGEKEVSQTPHFGFQRGASLLKKPLKVVHIATEFLRSALPNQTRHHYHEKG